LKALFKMNEVMDKKEKMVPELRFKEFKEKWSVIPNPIKIQSGVAYAMNDYVEHGALLVQGFNIGPGYLKIDEPYYISTLLDRKHVEVKNRDILLALNRPITNGKLKICQYTLEKPAFLYQRAGKLVFNVNRLTGNFIYQYLRTPQLLKKILLELVGSDQPYIRSDLFEVIKIKFPSLPEQQKIANFLSAVDQKIQQLQRKKELLTQYKKGMMQKLFNQEIRFKPDPTEASGDEQGNDFPEWEEKKLGEVCTVNPKVLNLPQNFNYIDLESVSKGQLTQRKRIDLEEAPSRAQRYLSRNDILYQTVRPYQMNNYFFDLKGEYVASTGYAQLRPVENPIFLYQKIHDQNFVNKVLVRCTGTSYPAINSKDLAKIKIEFPSLPEQQKIANFLSALDEKVAQVGQQIEQAQRFKKGLLQKMFV